MNTTPNTPDFASTQPPLDREPTPTPVDFRGPTTPSTPEPTPTPPSSPLDKEPICDPEVPICDIGGAALSREVEYLPRPDAYEIPEGKDPYLECPVDAYEDSRHMNGVAEPMPSEKYMG